MIIENLNFCEAVEFANEIVGATANTIGYAYAGPSSATAGATATGSGYNPYASVNTDTSVIEKKNVIKSKAKIKADAFAIGEDGKKDKDKIRATDVYVLHK